MELTDFRLYDKASKNLINLVLPLPWPEHGKSILEFARQATSKILPDIVAFANMWGGRPGLPEYQNLDSFQWWSQERISNFINKFTSWIQKLRSPLEPIFYATYSIENNRISNIFNFNASTLIANFAWGKKNEFIVPVRFFCYMIGGPLTTVQRREVGGKNVWVLCTPKEAVPYAT